MSLSHSCCCCLLRPSEKALTKPYLNYGITEIYSEILVECFAIHITLGHEGECGICEECVVRLRDARDFKLQVRRSQEQLRARLGTEVHIKDEKPNVQQLEITNKDGSSDLPMLHEEVIIKPEVVDENEIYHDISHKEPPIKSEVPNDADEAAEANTISHEDPSDEAEMSDNEMSDADPLLHEPDVDIATAPDSEHVDRHVDENLPSRSKDRYVATYESFVNWKNEKNTSSFSENVVLAYFEDIAEKYKPTSLWAIYSMLKKTMKSKHCINMEDYSKVGAFLRKKSDGYVSKKTKVLTAEDVEKFIDEAPDDKYLATKVALIFGVTGALRQVDLSRITTDHFENHDKVLLVKFPYTKNKLSRPFVIEGKYYDVVKKYEKLRRGTDKRFFQQYRNGRCTAQGIGKNKFGSMPKEVAEYLNLPDAKCFTGHSFRRSSPSVHYMTLSRKRYKSLKLSRAVVNST